MCNGEVVQADAEGEGIAANFFPYLRLIQMRCNGLAAVISRFDHSGWENLNRRFGMTGAAGEFQHCMMIISARIAERQFQDFRIIKVNGRLCSGAA